MIVAGQRYNISMRSSRHGIGGPRPTGFPWSMLVIVVLVAALVAVSVVAFPSMNYRTEAKKLYIERMQKECDTALQYSKYLSRTASSNSNAQLAAIRASIYSMDVLNQTYSSLEGEGHILVDQNVFSALYNVLDNYYNKLATAMNTSEQLTDLTAQLESMKVLVGNLE